MWRYTHMLKTIFLTFLFSFFLFSFFSLFSASPYLEEAGIQKNVLFSVLRFVVLIYMFSYHMQREGCWKQTWKWRVWCTNMSVFLFCRFFRQWRSNNPKRLLSNSEGYWEKCLICAYCIRLYYYVSLVRKLMVRLLILLDYKDGKIIAKILIMNKVIFVNF